MHVYCICIKYTLYVYIYTHICGSGYVYGHVATIHVHVANCVHVCVHVFACVCVFVCTRVIFVRMSYLPHCIHTHTHTHRWLWTTASTRFVEEKWTSRAPWSERKWRLQYTFPKKVCSTHSQKMFEPLYFFFPSRLEARGMTPAVHILKNLHPGAFTIQSGNTLTFENICMHWYNTLTFENTHVYVWLGRHFFFSERVH